MTVFENSTKCLICDNVYLDGDVQVRVHVMSLKNIEALHIEIVVSMLDQIIKFLWYFTT